MILPIYFFVTGIIYLICSNKKPNKFFGYRTKVSLSNEKIWEFVNYKIGIEFIKNEIFYVFIASIMYVLGFRNGYFKEYWLVLNFIILIHTLSALNIIKLAIYSFASFFVLKLLYVAPG